MKDLFKPLVLISTLFFTSSTYAVIIEGNFWGVANSIFPIEDSPLDNFEVVADGTKVSGFFWYDTDKAKQYQSDPPGNDNYFYSSTDEWMGSGFSVNGKTYTLSDGVPDLPDVWSRWESIYLVSLNPPIDGSTREWFYLADVFFEPDTDIASLMSIQLRSEEAPLLNGLDMIQEFDWYDLGDPLSQGFADLTSSTIVDGVLTGASVSIDIKEFHIGIQKPVDVPEPSSIVLLAFGLAIICARRSSGKVKFAL